MKAFFRTCPGSFRFHQVSKPRGDPPQRLPGVWLDLARRRIHVRESVKGPLKDSDSRVVPILDRLVPVLQEWKLRTGGKDRVIPALRSDGVMTE